MRFWRSIGLLALTLGVLVLPAHAATKKKTAKTPAVAAKAAPRAAQPDSVKARAVRPPHKNRPERRAWMIGYAFGAGSASFHGTGHAAFAALGPAGFSTASREMGTVNEFRLGYALRPSLAVSVERTVWSKTINGDAWNLGVTALCYTWYPAAGHFYLRGGCGVGDAFDKDVTDALAGTNIKHQDDGLGLVGAAGYEWPIFRRISICPQVAASYMSLDRKVFADYGTASLGLSWWF